MLHMIRQIIGADEKCRGSLRGLNKTFWHQTVTGAQVQAYINRRAKIDFTPVFAQYLTTTRIPELEYAVTNSGLRYRWTNVVPGFAMPVRVTIAGQPFQWLTPAEGWKTLPVRLPRADELLVDPSFYVTTRLVTNAPK